MSEIPKYMETVFLRAPRIFVGALHRKYGDYSVVRPYLKPMHHWVAESPLNPDEHLVIHGIIDRDKPRLRDAVERLEVGIISLEDMGASWLVMTKPREFMDWDPETLSKLGSNYLDDPFVSYISEQYEKVGFDAGDLVTDRDTVKRLAQYSMYQASAQIHEAYLVLPAAAEL